MDLTSMFDRGRRRADAGSAGEPLPGGSDPELGDARRRLERIAREATEAGSDRAGAGPGAAGPREGVAEGPAEAAGALQDPRTLAAVLESAPDGIVLLDETGKIEEWSPAAERILGHSREQVLGRDLVELVFPDHLREAMTAVLESRGSGWGEAAQRSIDVELWSATGESVRVQLSLAWAAGSGLFAAHLRDARERGERERELASEARRRARLLELGQVALGERELDRVIALASRTAREEIGLNASEVWRYEPESGELSLLHGHGVSTQAGARMRPAPGSRVAEALAGGSADVIAGDPLLPSPWRSPQDRQEGAPTGIAAVIATPDGPLGVIGGSADPGATYTATDESLLESVALILAQAIERRRFNRSLEEAEERLRSLVERLPAITYRAGLGADGRWQYVSPQVEEILGLSPEECMADNDWWEKLMHPDDVNWVLAEEERVGREGRELDISYRMRAADGRAIWVRDRSSIAAVEDGKLIVEGLISDITAQKEAEERLRHLADHDDLTDLLNRRGFEAEVDEALHAAAPARGALAIIDLDHLKRVNDSLGHAAGDALLKEIAASIRLSLRPADVFSRLSGDEFALFIPGIDEATAKRRVEDLIEMIRQSGRGGPGVTASAGVIMIEGADGLRASELLVNADLALYRAKEQGRDRVAVSEPDDRERMRWISEVRQAVEEERLALYAQPIIDLETGEPHSAELLVRMIDSEGRPVAAGQFIPTAERFGLIRAIDRWVAAKAVAVAARGTRVSVNVSAASIADPDLTELVGERLRATPDLDPAMITFEITETVATPSVEILTDFADRVERLGCGLALDDVGTGFGTLTYLQNLRFSQLKIDMAFVRGVLDSATDRGIVRSLVLIAGQLGLATVAEGVEREDVLAVLRELGVHRAQGYWIGEPAPVDL